MDPSEAESDIFVLASKVTQVLSMIFVKLVIICQLHFN